MTSYMYVIELVYWSRCENRIQHENLFNKATNSHHLVNEMLIIIMRLSTADYMKSIREAGY